MSGWWRRGQRWVGDRLAFVLVATLGLALFPYSAALNNPNERTRVLQARALVARGELHIGESVEIRRGQPSSAGPSGGRGRFEVHDLYGGVHGGPFVNDVALVCDDPSREPPRCAGKIYPAKPPGAALLGVPALWLADALGLVPEGPAGEARATWILRYGGVALPMLLGLVVLARLLARAGLDKPLRDKVVLAAGLGTTIFPYGLMVVGHATAGAALLGGALCGAVARERSGRGAVLLSVCGGLVTGSAVLLEYHAAPAALVIFGWTLFDRERSRIAPGFAVGGFLAFLAFGALHTAMFGSPFKTGHFFLMTEHNRQGQAAGFLGIDGPHPTSLLAHLFDPYMGLLPIMPWLFVGLVVGVPTLWRKRTSVLGTLPLGLRRALALLPLVYLLFVALLANHRTMNGWSIGPRYLVPAMLPMAFVAGVGWWRLARSRPVAAQVMAGLAAASMFIVVALTATYPSPPDDVRNPFAELTLNLIPSGFAVRNVFMGLGPWSLVVLGAVLLSAVIWVVHGRSQDGESRRELARTAGWTWVAALVWVVALALVRPTEPERVEAERAFCRETGEGLKPDRSSQGPFLP